MASGDSGDSLCNAAIAAMEGGEHMLNIGCNTPRWDLC